MEIGYQRGRLECKFTPLGFETIPLYAIVAYFASCKFTPLGFETIPKSDRAFKLCVCKFTPLGFETLGFAAVSNSFKV